MRCKLWCGAKALKSATWECSPYSDCVRTGRSRVKARVPRVTNFRFPHRVLTGFGVHPSSSPMGTGVLSSGVKGHRSLLLTPYPNYMPRAKNVDLHIRVPIRHSWSRAWLTLAQGHPLLSSMLYTQICLSTKINQGTWNLSSGTSFHVQVPYVDTKCTWCQFHISGLCLIFTLIFLHEILHSIEYC